MGKLFEVIIDQETIKIFMKETYVDKNEVGLICLPERLMVQDKNEKCRALEYANISNM